VVRTLLAAGLLIALLPAHALAQRGRAGTLILQGDFPGAEVYVDAESVGILPLEPLELRPGNHTLRVIRPGFTEFTEVFRIRPRRRTVIQVELMALSMVLSVVSDPPGARIFVDGQFQGEAPREVNLLEGEHSLRLELRGHHDALRSVNALAGVNDSLEVTLEPLPADELALLEPEEPTLFERPVTWVLVGAGALVAATGIILAVVLTSDSPSEADDFCQPSGMDCVRLQVDGI
jgi:hypothetical protein